MEHGRQPSSSSSSEVGELLDVWKARRDQRLLEITNAELRENCRVLATARSSGWSAQALFTGVLLGVVITTAATAWLT